jgi:hypothetical protein
MARSRQRRPRRRSALPPAGSNPRAVERELSRFEADELSVEELRERLEGLEDEEARELAEMLQAIELGVCAAERRGVALEQLAGRRR